MNIDEWHSFGIGFLEILCPWKARFPMPMGYDNPLEREYHYYLMGRGVGVIAWLIIAKVAQIVFW